MAVAFLALAGVADMVPMVFRGAILLSAATDELRGRMQGVFTVVVADGPRLADAPHGTAGSVVGARAAVAGGGLLIIAAALVLALATPALRAYRIGAPYPRTATHLSPGSGVPGDGKMISEKILREQSQFDGVIVRT